MILLYADDPGAANYLAPLSSALEFRGMSSRFVIDPALATYAADRKMVCVARPPTAEPEELLSGVQLLVIGTSEAPSCFGHQLTAAARRLGSQSLGVVDMEVNAARRFRGLSEDPLRHAPDFLAVTDKVSRDAFVGLGFPADRIAVCGHPHYDHVRLRRADFEAQDRKALRRSLFPDAPAGQPIWMFLAEGVDQLNPAVSRRSSDYTLHGRGDTDFRAAIVLEEILDAVGGLSPRPWIVLRLHPKNRLEEFEVCRAEVDTVSSGGDPLPMVWAADFVIGMTTMLLLETYLLGRPHVAVLPRASEKSWLTTLANGSTPFVCTRPELIRHLANSHAVSAQAEDHLPYDAERLLTDCVRRILASHEGMRQ